MLLLPEAGAREATQFAERLRKQLAAMEVGFNEQTFRITASLGVAERSANDSAIDEVIERADQALYQAKEQGRDQVVCWQNERVQGTSGAIQ